MSGLDIALWDIKGKKHDTPIWQLLGGKVRDRVKVYGWIGGDKPHDVVRHAKARKDQGFTAVKMNATGIGPLFELHIGLIPSIQNQSAGWILLLSYQIQLPGLLKLGRLGLM